LPATRRQFLSAASGALAWASLRNRAFAIQASGAPAESLAPKLARDPLRPQFHLLPAANWMNDPNGPVFWKGKYHLFFQYNPNGAYWGDMHWAHAVSTDLVHWKHLPVALAPTPGGYDSEGCFSGSTVIDHGTPTIIYTGVQNAPVDQATLVDGEHSFRETQCLATSHDPELRTWNKLPQPVISAPPAGMKVTGFRDPCMWRDGTWWYLAIGSGEPHVGGEILLYRSRDLRHWEYLHVLHGGKWSGKAGKNPVDTGEMWECPDFFALDGKHVLLYSTEGKVIWEVGEYDTKELKFHPQKQGLLDLGAYYAPKSMLAPDGKRILFGWVTEKRPEAEYRAAGWAGAMALPRVLNVNSAGELEMRVVSQIDQLSTPAGAATASSPLAQSITGSIHGLSGEVSGSFPAGLAATFSLAGVPDPLLRLRFEGTSLVIDDQAPVRIRAGQRVNFNVFLDGSIMECFVNDQIAFTKRVYPKGITAETETVATLDTPVSGGLVEFKVWQMRAISPGRLSE
jgi:beta-fructofuranosidase